MSASNFTIQFRKRAWWFWLLSVVWILLVLFFLNLGIASAAEMEPQASLYGYVTAAVLIVIGIAGYIVERRKAK